MDDRLDEILFGCPFCWSPPEEVVIEDTPDWSSACCLHCGCLIQAPSRNDVVNLWNHRRAAPISY